MQISIICMKEKLKEREDISLGTRKECIIIRRKEIARSSKQFICSFDGCVDYFIIVPFSFYMKI